MKKKYNNKVDNRLHQGKQRPGALILSRTELIRELRILTKDRIVKPNYKMLAYMKTVERKVLMESGE